MKIIYTILFFAVAGLLVAQSFLFLQLTDKGMSNTTLVMMLLGMTTCISLLVYLLSQYLKDSSRNNIE
jgi:uncharacterized PurR-regulated membrane protein YhhQ (DUF165 family)